MRRDSSLMIALPFVIGALTLTVVAALATSARAEDPRATTVSLIQLIANPAAFDGKRVSLVGYAVLEAAHTAAYLNETDARYGITRNAVWLDVALPGDRQRVQLHNRYVLIEGRFTARQRGDRELFSGIIDHIGRFEPVEPRPGPIVPAPH